MIVDVLIPALDEAEAIGLVIDAVPRSLVRRIVVCDNGSRDGTADVARAHGAIVVYEPERGYGAACLRAIAFIEDDPPDVVVFLDGDHSDFPEDLPDLLAPIERGEAELVIGSRALGGAQAGALTPQQRFGNRIASLALRGLYGVRTSDLGPFRAITFRALSALGMRDRDYGWTVEMQIRAARAGIRAVDVPVRYRVRVGRSKVSGTVRGTIGASVKILWLLGRYAWP